MSSWPRSQPAHSLPRISRTVACQFLQGKTRGASGKAPQSYG
jgi:hypothetical protein